MFWSLLLSKHETSDKNRNNFPMYMLALIEDPDFGCQFKTQTDGSSMV